MSDRHPIINTLFESIIILTFEFMGTAMLTSLFVSTCGTRCITDAAGNINCFTQTVGMSMFIGYFILLVFSARISGSHYNPVITLAFMLRKDAGQFNKWLGILYMLAQVAGAFVGCLLVFYCFDKRSLLTVNSKFPLLMLTESMGAFILVIVYLTQTEERYKLSLDAAITLMIISASYVIGMAF